MPKESPLNRFLKLVERVNAGTTARSENDLSSQFARVLDDLGLYTVIDTRVTSGRGKRPDILGYTSEQNANLVLAAELVIEAKKPEEVTSFPSLAEAMVSDHYWDTKTYPYLRDNIGRVQYFVFTTFNKFAILPITQEIRKVLIHSFKAGDLKCETLRVHIRNETLLFHLNEGRGSSSTGEWIQWIESHFNTKAITPIPLSSTRNLTSIANTDDLEQLAAQLATFAAGSGDPSLPDSGLFQSIRLRLKNTYSQISAETRRDLLIYTMTQYPGLNVEQAERKVQEDISSALDDFVAASIHSLISRLFAIKVIEDAFCVNEEEPLVEPEFWLFNTEVYDTLSSEALRTEIFRRIRGLTNSLNPLIQSFTRFGFFFDWIEEYIDPVVFRSLIETLSINDFNQLEEDLLGRFYELYAQQVNRSRRKALGQYYTPLTIVQFMWQKSAELIRLRKDDVNLTVLDPAMGSATFLAEGARVLAKEGISNFWECLIGFDISAQILGIAHVNLYMAVLSQLTPDIVNQVKDLKIYATDTLDIDRGDHLRQILPLILDDDTRQFLEQKITVNTQLKKQSNFRLVIGNPPYRNNSNLTLAQVANRFPRLLSSSVEHGGAQRRNIRDDYAWFIAAADFYVQDQGIICFILSDSFVLHRSYEHLRFEILRHYHIHFLVHLGTHIFPDVSPRTSFAIILLERRDRAITPPQDIEPISYYDLRPLVTNASLSELGTFTDPRLQYLRAVIQNDIDLQATASHVPSALTHFSFYPTRKVSERFNKDAVDLFEQSGQRLFTKKWPGIITAFDVLFKGKTQEELQDRISSLFSLCNTPKISNAEMERRVEQWGREHSFNDEQLATLILICVQIRQLSLNFESHKIKRSFSGSIPEDARWYPPQEFIHYLYYEPLLNVPRNENPGRPTGWGTMNQWREPLSHQILPKLIYTTASRPQNGYAAFVVNDEWYVKLHGGTSQQFHYTGLENPLNSQRLDGLPNNLSDLGIRLFTELVNANEPSDTLLYYVAGIWNSKLASEFLEESGSSQRPKIRIPNNKPELQLILQIAKHACSACQLLRLSQYSISSSDKVPAKVLDAIATPALLIELGFQQQVEQRKRFQDQVFYLKPTNVCNLIQEQIEVNEAQVNDLVELLYS